MEGLMSTEFHFDLEGDHLEPAEVLRHIKAGGQPRIYVLVDFHPFLSNPLHVRLLKDIAMQHELVQKTIVLLSHDLICRLNCGT
jgi:hypothetical protein